MSFKLSFGRDWLKVDHYYSLVSLSYKNKTIGITSILHGWVPVIFEPIAIHWSKLDELAPGRINLRSLIDRATIKKLYILRKQC